MSIYTILICSNDIAYYFCIVVDILF